MTRVGRKTVKKPREVWKKASAHKPNLSIFKILNERDPAGKLPFLDAALKSLISAGQWFLQRPVLEGTFAGGVLCSSDVQEFP